MSMVEFVTKSGVILDLDPDCEFQIEINNPIFEDDGIPVPFSTAISFLPTPKNRQVFGFLDAMMLQPTVFSLEISIYIGGFLLVVGTLSYESIDDGKLNYTFAERDIETDSWNTPISDLDEMVVSFSPSLSISQFYNYLINNANSDGLMSAPFLIPEASIAKYPTSGMWNWWSSSSSKLYNFLPAVNIKKILQSFLPDIQTTSPVFFGQINLWCLCGGIGTKSISVSSIDLSTVLPDITCADLLRGVMAMYCAFMFRDNGSWTIRLANEILSSMANVDWDDKISDIYSQELVSSEAYKLSFDLDESNSNSGSDPVNYEDIEAAGSFETMLNNFAGSGDNYIARRHADTQGCFSGKGSLNTQADMLTPGPLWNSVLVGGEDNPHEVSIPFQAVRSTPLRRTSAPDGRRDFLAPIVKMKLDTRPDKVIVGALLNNQLVEHGLYLFTNTGTYVEQYGADIQPGSLYNNYHCKLATWYSKKRQMIKAQLNLTISDIFSFRMYQPVSVRSRRFLVKTLRLTMRANTDFIISEADLVSM